MSDIGLFLLMFAGLLLLLGVIRFLAWLTELQETHGSVTRAGVNTVKRYVAPRPRDTSSSVASAAPSFLSSPETDSLQTAYRQPQPAQPGRPELLTLYQTMRAAGISREKARPVLKGVGLSLDNNLWAEAAPPDDPHITPVAGRPTDADFPFQPLA